VTTQTSGGVPLTRARLAKALNGLPLHAAYSEHDRPYRWRIVHVLDRATHRVESDEDFEAVRSVEIRRAAHALTAAGYNVTLRHIPDADMLAGLPTALREQMADTIPTLQVIIEPD
jgi:hypothetical protein